jgi:hypothetical protein
MIWTDLICGSVLRILAPDKLKANDFRLNAP